MSEFQPNEISTSLKLYFSDNNITQQQIADKLGISQAAVGKWLNGKPFGKKTAAKWSEVFGLNPSWLLTGNGPMLKDSAFISTATDQISMPKEVFDLIKSQQETLLSQQRTIENLSDSVKESNK